MASIQSHLLRFIIKRQHLFASENFNPVATRGRLDKWTQYARPHRKVTVSPVNAGGVPSEWLVPQDAPADKVILYIHGGAWFMGSTSSHRMLVSQLAYAVGIRALSINYRLAPEHPFPAGLDDCRTAYHWLLAQGYSPDKMIVAADSAGGNLALALLLALRDAGEPLPAGAVGLSAATDLAATGASRKTRVSVDPYFGDMGLNSIIPDYIGEHDPYEPLISPLFADLAELPPLLLHVGDYEILLDDTVSFGKKAVEAGVDAQTVVWPEMFHVFQTFAPFLPEARQAIRQIAAFINQTLERAAQ